MRFRPIQISLALLAIMGSAGVAFAQDQVHVTAQVDRRSLTLTDDLQLEVTIEGSFARFADPPLEGLTIAGRSQSQQISIVNGRYSRQQTVTYRLTPQRAGKATIGAASAVDQNGRVIGKSEPITITVTKPEEQAPVSQDEAHQAAERSGQPYFLRAETDRDHYYVGEPFVITWNLYFRTSAGVEATEIVTPPKLENLLVEDVMPSDRRPRVRTKVVGKRRLRVVPRAIQLATPLKPGVAVVDTMTMRLTVGDFFNRRRMTLRSRPFELRIRKLPDKGRPVWFREGNVGRFRMTASLKDEHGDVPTKVATGQRFVLDIMVSGEGNLVSVKPPVLEGGEQFDIQPLPTAGEDRITKDATGMHGQRTFQFLLTPLEPGSFDSPTVRFSFFDPDAGRYQTLTQAGTKLEVEGKKITAESSEAAYMGEDIRPIVEHAKLRVGPRSRATESPIFWLGVFLPPLFFLFWEIRHRWLVHRSRDPLARLARGAGANAKKRLLAAERALKDELVKDFYGQITRTLTAYLEERANIPATGMTHHELRRAAIEAGYPSELVEEVVVEMENCDFARFAPAASADQRMRETLGRASQLVKQLETVEPRRRP